MREVSASLSKAFNGYFFGVLFSRVFGMLRDVSLAFFFGTSKEIALFMIAYRFSNLMRRMLAEGPLSSSFIPLYQKIEKNDKNQGLIFFRDLSAFTLLILPFFLLFLHLILSFSFKSIDLKEDNQQIVSLTLKMLPSLYFITLYGVFSAFLQANRSFFLPALAPIAFNLVWILGGCFIYIKSPLAPLETLSYFVVIAFLVQWLFIAPKTYSTLRKKLSLKQILSFRPFSSYLKQIISPFFLGILGVGTTQINAALDALFAKAADPSGPAYLWYAIRIEQVPVALFAVAMSTAALPTLSKAIQNKENVEGVIQEGVEKVYPLMSFSMFGLISCGLVCLKMIFARGAFDSFSLFQTYKCLVGYSLGLIPHGLALFYTSCFYAIEEFKIPVRSSLYAILIHIALNLVLVFLFKLGDVSIALSTTFSSIFQAVFLFSTLKKTYPSLSLPSCPFLKQIGIGLIALVLSFWGVYSLFYQPLFIGKEIGFISTFTSCALSGTLFVGSYVALELFLKDARVFSFLKLKFFK